MCRHLGVSKAVLNNVIFCHQEDSNWQVYIIIHIDNCVHIYNYSVETLEINTHVNKSKINIHTCMYIHIEKKLTNNTHLWCNVLFYACMYIVHCMITMVICMLYIYIHSRELDESDIWQKITKMITE